MLLIYGLVCLWLNLYFFNGAGNDVYRYFISDFVFSSWCVYHLCRKGIVPSGYEMFTENLPVFYSFYFERMKFVFHDSEAVQKFLKCS